MKRYTYKIVTLDTQDEAELEQALNMYGNAGYECFQVNKEHDEYIGSKYTVFFKKETELIIVDNHIDKYESEFLKNVSEKYKAEKVEK